MKTEPFKIINAASHRSPDGGTTVDIEALVVALITVCKAGHMNKAQVIADFGRTWDEVEVETRVPGTGRA